MYALDQPGRSLTMVNKAIERAKKNKPLAVQCYSHKSTILCETGDTIQAIKALTDGLKVDSKNVDLLVKRAGLLIYSGKDSALDDLNKAKKLAPSDYRVYQCMACFFMMKGNFMRALDEVSKAIAIDNSLANSYALRGNILHELGYSPDWIRDCLHSVELEGLGGFGTNLLAEVADKDERATIINEIESSRIRSNGFYQLEAALQYLWGMYDGAAKTFQEIIDLGMADANTYYLLADCQYHTNFMLAYATASRGLDLYSDNLSLKFLKARIGVNVGKGAEALDILDSFIADSPETEEFYVEKGKAYMSLGRYDEACEPLSTAMILNPSIINRINYADALRLSGSRDKANAVYNEILQMTDSDFMQQGYPPEAIRAVVYSGLGRQAEALASLKSLSETAPDFAVSSAAMIHARLGDTGEAVKALRNFAASNQWNALTDLYSYEFHNLHREPAFVELMAEHGVTTKFNPETHLLEYDPKGRDFSKGGTDLNAVINSLDDSSDWVRHMNDNCPIDLGIAGQLTSVDIDLDSEAVIFNMTSRPELVNADIINANPDLKRRKEDVMGLMILNVSPEVADIDTSIIYNYNDADGTLLCSFKVSSKRIKELKRMSKSQNAVDEMRLDLQYEEEKALFASGRAPLPGEVAYDGKVYAYTFFVPEDDGTLASLELFQNEQKSAVASSFSDPAMQLVVQMFVRRNITLKYIYKGRQSGKTVEIAYTPEELSHYVK